MFLLASPETQTIDGYKIRILSVSILAKFELLFLMCYVRCPYLLVQHECYMAFNLRDLMYSVGVKAALSVTSMED